MSADALRDSLLARVDVPDLCDRYWYLLAALPTLAVELVTAYRLRAGLGSTERLPLRDSVIFEFIGLHLARGGRLYETIWEIKPPVAFEVPWLLATLVGQHRTLYHAASIGASIACVVGSAVLVAGYVRHVTGDTLAGVLASFVPFALVNYYWRATFGFKAKYLVLLLALLAIYLRVRDRPLGSGLASALAVGTWQLAAVVPLVTALATLGRRWGDLSRYLVGLVLGTAIALGPVLWWGTETEFVVETVFVPLLGTEDARGAGPIVELTDALGMATPLFAAGLGGLVLSLLGPDRRDVWPATAVAGWLLAAVLFVDFDTPNDLIPLVAFLAIGVGLLVGYARGIDRDWMPAVRVAAAAVVLAFALTSLATFGGYGSGSGYDNVGSYDTAREVPLELPYNETERQHLYWSDHEAPTCRVFSGVTQYELVKRLGLAAADEVSYWEPSCGQWEPTWAAVREKYGLGDDTGNDTSAAPAVPADRPDLWAST